MLKKNIGKTLPVLKKAVFLQPQNESSSDC